MSTNRDLPSMLQLSFDNIPGNTFQNKLNFLSKCKCCRRHNTNKPYTFITWVDTPHNYNHKKIKYCNCKCRHIARLICRQTTDYNPLI